MIEVMTHRQTDTLSNSKTLNQENTQVTNQSENMIYAHMMEARDR